MEVLAGHVLVDRDVVVEEDVRIAALDAAHAFGLQLSVDGDLNTGLQNAVVDPRIADADGWCVDPAEGSQSGYWSYWESTEIGAYAASSATHSSDARRWRDDVCIGTRTVVTSAVASSASKVYGRNYRLMSGSSETGPVPRLSRIAAVLRGLCPRCREGRVFRGIVTMNERCARCDLRFEREPGYFLGAMYVSYAFAVALVAAIFGLVSLLFPQASFETVFAAAALLFLPFVPGVFRYSRIVWLHFDHAVDPP